MILFYFVILFSAVPNHPWFGYEHAGLNLIKVVGLLCLFYALFHSTLQGRFPAFFATWPSRLFALLIFLACLSYALKGSGEDPSSSRTALVVYLEYFTLFLITVAVVIRRTLASTILAICLHWRIRAWISLHSARVTNADSPRDIDPGLWC